MSPSRVAVAAGAGGALALAASGVYRLPRSRAGAEELYADVDPATFASLEAFRRTHPARRVTVDGHTWE